MAFGEFGGGFLQGQRGGKLRRGANGSRLEGEGDDVLTLVESDFIGGGVAKERGIEAKILSSRRRHKGGNLQRKAAGGNLFREEETRLSRRFISAEPQKATQPQLCGRYVTKRVVGGTCSKMAKGEYHKEVNSREAAKAWGY